MRITDRTNPYFTITEGFDDYGRFIYEKCHDHENNVIEEHNYVYGKENELEKSSYSKVDLNTNMRTLEVFEYDNEDPCNPRVHKTTTTEEWFVESPMSV